MSEAIVIGAGVAGLAAAVELAAAGRKVRLFEAAGQAGGRCRSFLDEQLGTTIDNGNHLMLSGNFAIRRFVDRIGSADTLFEWSKPAFSFVDVASGESWLLSMGDGIWPGWLFSADRRVPDTRLRDYFSLLKVAFSPRSRRLGDILNRDNPLYERFWQPLAVAVLNTEVEEASAGLLGRVLRETFLKGGRFARPIVAQAGLSETFARPALDYLASSGAKIELSTRIAEIRFGQDQVTEIAASGESLAVGPDDPVILALPPGQAAALLPRLEAPEQFRPIVNVHFHLPAAVAVSEPRIVGVIGGTAQWVFRRGDIASVTISAASDVVSWENRQIAERTWPDVCAALKLGSLPIPPHRVIKERRATIAQTVAMDRSRPGAQTEWRNLFLAGDWTDTGLPATIEGATRSGQHAARLALTLQQR